MLPRAARLSVCPGAPRTSNARYLKLGHDSLPLKVLSPQISSNQDGETFLRKRPRDASSPEAVLNEEAGLKLISDLPSPGEEAQMEFSKYMRDSVPILNKIKQTLNQIYFNYVTLTSDAFLHCWNPESEYNLMALQDELSSLVAVEEELDRMCTDEREDGEGRDDSPLLLSSYHDRETRLDEAEAKSIELVPMEGYQSGYDSSKSS